ncbi:MAG: hypothetical protein Q8L81_08965 [Bacteroidota bacterium]|nr:hypothetical protein [Bacteroidota bacterium]
MEIIIAYDVNIRQGEVKTQMLNEGFFDNIIRDRVTYYLPDTTLYHPNLVNPTTAKNIFERIIRELNQDQAPNRVIRIKRVMAFQLVAGWSPLPGDPHA